MTTKETLGYLDQLIASMEALNKMWDEIESWSEANLDPLYCEAA